jgi:hypothetical protein
MKHDGDAAEAKNLDQSLRELTVHQNRETSAVSLSAEGIINFDLTQCSNQP